MPCAALPLALALALARAAAADPAAERFRELARELERDHADPRAIAVLAEMRALEDDLADLPGAARAYGKLAEDPQALPEVRAWARVALAEVERARGSLTRSQAQATRLAFVEDWLAAGPFDDEGRRGHGAVYPPEREQDPAARMPGKVREVGWRVVPAEARRLGFVDLGATMRPTREVTAYALAVLESPREQRVRLLLGASGAVKLWVNGALALEDAAAHPARPDQLAAAATLRKGPNRVLVKISQEDGRLGLYLRLATPGGAPLRLPSGPLDPLPAAQAPAAEGPQRLPGLVAALERRARQSRGREEARARRDLALALLEKRSSDERERRALEEARRAAALAPRSPEARLLAARLEPDGNRQREHLEAALAAAPDHPGALLALGLHHLHRGRPHRAIPYLRSAAARGGAAARLALADGWEAAGLPARARRIRLEAARDFPLLPGAALAAARTARSLDRMAEASRHLRKALALRFDDAGARATLEQLLADRGDVEGALRLLDEALRLAPADLGARLRQADLLAANGRRDEAEASFAAAARLCPEEEEVRERRGRARLRDGRTAEGVADLRAALELRPQSAHLKEILRALQPEQERYERPYALDARALLGSLAGGAGARPGEDAVVLGELRVTRVFPSGLASRYQQLVVKVLTQRGADALRRHVHGYVPGRQEVRVERARVVRPDGAALEGAQESDRSASEPWYRLWYDTRTRALAFPALEPGDLLELAVRTDDVAGENLLSNSFGDLVQLPGAFRKLRWEYVLLMPPGRALHASETPPGVERTERAVEGAVEHRWRARDLERVEPEPGMPGWTEVAPYLHVSTFASWDEVAAFWWGLVREQLVPDAEVRAAADRIAREVRSARRARGEPEAGDARALVEAVHAFVVTNVRYVGLEFGIHGYKPYRVDEVHGRRFGDCKDKASLAHAMLAHLGVDSRLVLLRMRRLGAVADRPASLSVFNHAILWVPALDLWLDGTAGFHGTRDLPGEDREASVLVVNPGAPAVFRRVPAARAEDAVTESAVTVRLAADGSAVLDGTSRVSGAAAPGYRRAYQSEGDRRAVLEQAFARTFPGLTVRSFEISDLSRLEEDVVLRFQLAQPRYADRDDGALAFAPFGAAHAYAETYAAASTRRRDLVVGEPYLNRFRYRVELPEGLAADDLPPAARGETPAARFAVSVRREGRALVAEGEVAMLRSRVGPEEYPAFRGLLLDLDRALARKVVLRRPRQARGAAEVGR
ncbi:MAG TPA: DUF3857 domain-containing protein [Anaeromyxobacteraceae bacterium]